MEALAAWREAVRYDSLRIAIVNAGIEPAPLTGFSRSLFLKALEAPDSVRFGKSRKYGNAEYSVNGVLLFRDWPSESFLEWGVRRLSKKDLAAVYDGRWTPVSVKCRARQLDDGSWIAEDYKFAPTANVPDFPRIQIK